MIEEKVYALSLPYPDREERLVRVYVPAHEEGERLPAVYMTDGQNLFDKESSGFGCWYTREAVRDVRKESGRAAILVGIHNDNPRRTDELSPRTIGEIQYRGDDSERICPEGEIFDDFLLHTVMPAVEERFPVRKGRDFTAFCGSSMGGLFAFYTALRHPEIYSAAGVLSPAFLLYAPEDLRRWIHAGLREEKPFLYLYSGAGEPLEKEICDSLLWTRDILDECWPEEKRKLLIQPEKIHHEVAWEPVFRDFLHIFLSN